MAYNNKFYLGDYVRIVEIGELMNEKSDNKEWINAVNVTGETPLHIAARRRILELFESMLPYYTDIEACDDQGNTVLHQLVDSNVESDEEHKQKRINLLQILISKGANINKKNRNGRTPVHLAAKNGHIEILETLKEGGADFSLRTNDGETALLLACKHMFKLRGTPAETSIIDFLVNDDCDVNAADDEGYTALHYAVEWCSNRTVMKLLEGGADVHSRTKEHKLTPLHLAAKRKKPTKLDSLVRGGATVKTEEIDALPPLHLALLESTWEVIERLIEYGSDVNYPEGVLQFTPLHLVVYRHRDDLFQLLINKGADVNSSGRDGLTPLHLSSMLGNAEFTQILIDHGVDVNCCDGNQATPLHLAIRKNRDVDRDIDCLMGANAITYGKTKSLIVQLLTCEDTSTNEDYEAVIRLLIDNRADVNAVTKFGRSSLHFAAEVGMVNFVKILVEHGADVDCKEFSSESTPLHLASDKNYKDVAEVLINVGANINALTKYGKSPMHSAVESSCMDILELLVEHKVDLNCMENRSRFTPLHLALHKNHKDAAKILIKAGANLNSLTKDGKNSTYLAVESKCTEVLKLLLEHEANIECKVAHSQFTPLHLALSKNYREAADVLIKAGADVNSVTQDGKSPMHLALESNCTEVLKLLLGRGAKLNCQGKRCLYTLLYISARNNDVNMLDQLDDSERTPLLLSINSLDNREVRKALLCLPALMDVYNENGCMSVNYEVENDYVDNSECLRIFGMNVNDFEVYSKFVFDRVMNAAFQKHHYILNYLTALIAIQLPLTYNYETYVCQSIKTLRLHDGERSCYQKCLDEVQKLKNYTVSGDVTLYSLLHIEFRRRRAYTNNLDFSKIQSKFPIYYKLILARCREAVIRGSLLGAAQLAFYQLTKVNVPILCIEEIFLNLDIMNIIATIEAAEI